jgi:hypothetical protein
VHDLQAERARRTDEATSPGGDACDHACASRAKHRPMDALRRLASRPRHVRPGPMMCMRARHPTRNRVYTLAAPRGWRIQKASEKNKQTPGRFGAAPGESSETGGNQVLGASGACGGLPADGAELGGAARGCGEGPWARARPPRRPHGQLCPGEEAHSMKSRGAGLIWVSDPGGGLARAHRLGGRQAGHARARRDRARV